MSETLAQRQPPQNLEAERSVLGSILLDPTEAFEAVRSLGLEPGHFYSESHRTIYRAMLRLDEAGSTVDLVTLTEELRTSSDTRSLGHATGVQGRTRRAASPSAAQGSARGV